MPVLISCPNGDRMVYKISTLREAPSSHFSRSPTQTLISAKGVVEALQEVDGGAGDPRTLPSNHSPALIGPGEPGVMGSGLNRLSYPEPHLGHPPPMRPAMLQIGSPRSTLSPPGPTTEAPRISCLAGCPALVTADLRFPLPSTDATKAPPGSAPPRSAPAPVGPPCSLQVCGLRFPQETHRRAQPWREVGVVPAQAPSRLEPGEQRPHPAVRQPLGPAVRPWTLSFQLQPDPQGPAQM